MSTNTTRLGLVKPAPAEDYDVGVFNANADKVDAAVGRISVTSGTRPSAPWNGQSIRETDTGNELFHNGTTWVHEGVPTVTALAQILAPYALQMVYLTTDNTVYQRNAANTAWVAMLPGGVVATPTAATRHEAEYRNAASQVIANAGNTRISFDQTVTESALVTRNTVNPGHTFTLNRAGMWVIQGTVRYQAGVGGAGERYMESRVNTSTVLGAQGGPGAAGVPTTMTINTSRRFAAGDVFEVQAYQSSGSTLGTDATAGWHNIRFAWQHG